MDWKSVEDLRDIPHLDTDASDLIIRATERDFVMSQAAINVIQAFADTLNDISQNDPHKERQLGSVLVHMLSYAGTARH